MKERIFDEIRGIWVEALPEEIVRQNLIKQMIGSLGFPKGLLCVEKDLCQIPHLKGIDSSKRRADIICFAKDIHPEFLIYPLLMVECKAYKITKEAEEQLIGYNHLVKSYFIALAGKDEIKTFWYSKKEEKYLYIDFLPSFSQLLNIVKKNEV